MSWVSFICVVYSGLGRGISFAVDLLTFITNDSYHFYHVISGGGLLERYLIHSVAL